MRHCVLLSIALAALCAWEVACDDAAASRAAAAAHRRAVHADSGAAAAALNDRLNKYMPHESRTLAEELRAAREKDRRPSTNGGGGVDDARVALRNAKASPGSDERAPSSQRAPNVKASVSTTAVERTERSSPPRKTPVTAASGIKEGIRAVRRVGRKATSRVTNYLDPEYDDDGDEYNDDDLDGDDVVYDDGDGYNPRTVRQARTRRRRTSTSADIVGTHTTAQRLGHIVVRLFWISVTAVRWSGRNVVWTPMTYLSAVVQWSAHTSWRTTRWTGERALVGPARTATAPLIYLVDGLLFIFVWVPAGILRTVARELYPVYVYLGAALAIGTAMGIAAAVALYIGSFLFGDESQLESSLQEKGQELPNDLARQMNDSLDMDIGNGKSRSKGRNRQSSNSASKRSNPGGSIIEQAIRESLARGDRAKNGGGGGRQQGSTLDRAWQQQQGGGGGGGADSAPDSDEEDDYFGSSLTPRASVSSSGRSKSLSPTSPNVVHPPARSAAGAALSPSITTGSSGRPMPVGATGQGGWSSTRSDNSSSSTPIASPVYTRPSIPSSPFAYASGSRAPSSASTSSAAAAIPHGIRAHQRRGVPSV